MSACYKDMDKDKMDEIGAWSIAVCKCAEKEPAEAKKCAAKHKEPDVIQQEYKHGLATYNQGSYQVYDGLRSTGDQCAINIEIANKPK
jgi:hypothetical protein